MNLFFRLTAAVVFTLFILVSISHAQASLAAINTPYVQNFDTLAATGTDTTFTDNITIVGWYSSRITYLPGTGSGTGGSLYSFGSTSSSERALGSIASGSTTTIRYGVRIKNNTGAAITSLDISFTGEQWRKSGVTVSHNLTFDYHQAATITDVTTGTFTLFSGLDFNSPVNTATGSALDGNAIANRTIKAATINVTIPVDEEIMLRWTDIDDTGLDHGLAIDDLSITPRAGTLAASASLGGRIVTSNGRGIRNAVLIISGGNLKEPKSAVTGSFGYYNFDGLAAGETYIITVNSKRFAFQSPSRIVTLNDNVADTDFIAEP